MLNKFRLLRLQGVHDPFMSMANGIGKDDAPPPPDYAAAARETAAGNLEAAKYTTQANRVNQVTPYGNLTYTQWGGGVNQAAYDQAMKNYQDQLSAYNQNNSSNQNSNGGFFGNSNNPISSAFSKMYPDSSIGGAPIAPNIKDYTTDNNQWTATQTLTPAQQKILEQNQNLSSGLLNTAQQGLDYASGIMSKPGIDMSSLPQVGINPGETYSDAIMRRLQPQIAQENEMSDAALANQGIAQGTEAYNNAKRTLQMGQNDRQLGAITSGMGVGLQANQQAFGQQGYNQMQPINVINALRTGSQVQAPSYVSVPPQANVNGPDLLGATGQQYNAQIAQNNANNAASNGFLGGLMNIGAAYAGRKV